MVSFHDIFNESHPLLHNNVLSMIVRILPAPTSDLSPETRFLFAARLKYLFPHLLTQ